MEPESILHLFWDCKITKNFWKNFSQWVESKCTHIGYINLQADLILFGSSTSFKTDELFDLIILLAKYYLYKCKLKEILPKVDQFKAEMTYYFFIDKERYFNKSLFNQFNVRWAMYRNLVDNS